MSIYNVNEVNRWIEKINRAILELQKEKGRITFDKVVEKTEIPTTVISQLPEISRYIIDNIKRKKKRNYIVKNVLGIVEDMISKRENVCMSDLSKKAGVSRTLLYEYTEIRERVQKYEKEEKIELVEKAIKELYNQREIITINKLQRILGLEKNYLTSNLTIRLWITEYNEQLRLDNHLEKVKIAIIDLRQRNEKVNISRVAKEMGMYTSYLYRHPKVIEYIKQAKEDSNLPIVLEGKHD